MCYHLFFGEQGGSGRGVRRRSLCGSWHFARGEEGGGGEVKYVLPKLLIIFAASILYFEYLYIYISSRIVCTLTILSATFGRYQGRF